MALPQNFPTAAEMRQRFADRAATFQEKQDQVTENRITAYLQSWIPTIFAAFVQLRANYNGETSITVTNPVLPGLESVMEFRLQNLFSALGYIVETKTSQGAVTLTINWKSL